jgi:hypothetical protein
MKGENCCQHCARRIYRRSRCTARESACRASVAQLSKLIAYQNFWRELKQLSDRSTHFACFSYWSRTNPAAFLGIVPFFPHARSRCSSVRHISHERQKCVRSPDLSPKNLLRRKRPPSKIISKSYGIKGEPRWKNSAHAIRAKYRTARLMFAYRANGNPLCEKAGNPDGR